MTIMGSYRLLALVTLASLFLSGCPSPPPVGDGGSDGGERNIVPVTIQTEISRALTLRDGVQVLSDDVARSITVSSEGISFSAGGNQSLLSLQPGAVLVSSYGAGFLRKVTRVEGPTTSGASLSIAASSDDQIKVFTSVADLTDVIGDGSWKWVVTPDPLTGTLDPLTAEGALDSQISLLTKWGLKPQFTVEIQIDKGTITRIEAEGLSDLSLDWKASLALKGEYSWTREGSLPELPIYRGVSLLGPLPVVVSLDLTAKTGLGFDIKARAKATIGGRCSKRLGGKVVYDSVTQAWALSDQSTPLDCPIDEPVLDYVDASATGSMFLKPNLELRLYEAVGAYAGLSGAIDLHVQACPPPSRWRADLTTRFHVGVAAGITNQAKDLYVDEAKTNLGNGKIPTPEICDYYEWAQWHIPADAPDPAVYAIANGTVTDTVTNLVWQQDVAPSQINWNEASTYCDNLVLGVTKGWRLPTAIELQSIARYAGSAPLGKNPWPAIDPNVFLGPAGMYWTSSAYAGQAGSAWTVEFTRGGVQKDDTTKLHTVRCVWVKPAEGVPLAHFTIDKSGSNVIDSKTGLTWQRGASATPFSTFAEAQQYCIDQGLRLPTIKELRSLVKIRTFNPAIDATIFPGTASGRFWSNTLLCEYTIDWSDLNNPHRVCLNDFWYTNFDDGSAVFVPRYATSAPVRCVK